MQQGRRGPWRRRSAGSARIRVRHGGGGRGCCDIFDDQLASAHAGRVIHRLTPIRRVGARDAGRLRLPFLPSRRTLRTVFVVASRFNFQAGEFGRPGDQRPCCFACLRKTPLGRSTTSSSYIGSCSIFSHTDTVPRHTHVVWWVGRCASTRGASDARRPQPAARDTHACTCDFVIGVINLTGRNRSAPAMQQARRRPTGGCSTTIEAEAAATSCWLPIS